MHGERGWCVCHHSADSENSPGPICVHHPYLFLSGRRSQSISDRWRHCSLEDWLCGATWGNTGSVRKIQRFLQGKWNPCVRRLSSRLSLLGDRSFKRWAWWEVLRPLGTLSSQEIKALLTRGLEKSATCDLSPHLLLLLTCSQAPVTGSSKGQPLPLCLDFKTKRWALTKTSL